ncbi:MAG: Dabb family protein [Clostridia bacterium]|nr:Dabb family protein [Clostridia bacterium]MBQ4065742.1 Dabb family protein [Clostridia bacterium]
MVKHIILWKLKEEHNTAAVKQGIKDGLEGLIGKIPGLVEISVQIDSLVSSNADVMLYSVFEDEAALKGYAVHPKHVFAADHFVRPYTQTRLCLDFEV